MSQRECCQYIQVQVRGSIDDVSDAMDAIQRFIHTDKRVRRVLNGTHSEDVEIGTTGGASDE